MFRFFLFLIFSLVYQVLLAQHSSQAYLELADSLYLHRNYASAAAYYEKALKKADQPGSIMLKAAKCYSKTNQLALADKWFNDARSNHARFLNEDSYQYTQVLLMQGKRKEAENILTELIQRDPNALFAKRWLADLQNYSKYYTDSVSYKVFPLSLNTPESEFAPEFYKDGIVFSAARSEKFGQKKYHWDNSDYLNLYFSKKISNKEFSKPKVFNKELNSKYHDGPVSFYDNFTKMIVNRNKSNKDNTKKNTWRWHLGLYDAYQEKDSSWIISPLPFDHPPYSFAHPSISEDGTTLFFVSDKPGGYGGTDIYKTVKVNGTWSTPFNLGPVINTSGNETFPFHVGATLYFSSNGHGGLGGLDIFKCTQSANGFTPPENLGYPVNSQWDDFSFIISEDQHTGYFSSSRNGNDDLFGFEYLKDKPAPVIVPVDIIMAARAFKEEDNTPLSFARVQIISFSEPEKEIITNAEGIVEFTLAEGTAYMIVATKDNLSGMHTGIAEPGADKLSIIHPVPARDTLEKSIPVIGIVTNKEGELLDNALATVTDKITGEEIETEINEGVLSFLGEKGHDYNIKIDQADHESVLDEIHVSEENVSIEKIAIVLEETEFKKSGLMLMAAHAFKEEDSTTLSDAAVKIITIVEDDQDIKTDSKGQVDFQIPRDIAYVVMVTQDDYSGMHTGVAEKGSEKSYVSHPIACHKTNTNQVAVVTLFKDKGKQISSKTKVTVADKETKELIAAEFRNGILTFYGEKGRDYEIIMDDPSATEVVSIDQEADEIDKHEIDLKWDIKTETTPVFVQIEGEPDNSLSQSDISVYEKSSGIKVSSNIEDGVIIFDGKKGLDYTIDVAGNENNHTVEDIRIPQDNNTPVSTSIVLQKKNKVPVVATIKSDQNGTAADAIITAKEKSGKEVPVQFNQGIASFNGEAGKEYIITVTLDDHETTTEEILIPQQAETIQDITITLPKIKSDGIVVHNFAARVFKADDQSPLSGAKIKIITMFYPDLELYAGDDGVVEYALEEDMAYVLIGDRFGYTGMYSGVAERNQDKTHVIHPVPAFTDDENKIPVITKITDQDGGLFTHGNVSVKEKSTDTTIPTEFKNGILTFIGEKNKDYTISIEQNNKLIQSKEIHLNENSTYAEESISLASNDNDNVPVITYISTEDNKLIEYPKIIVTEKPSGRRLPVNYDNSSMSFQGQKGKDYAVSVEHTNYQPALEELSIPNTLTQSPEVNIKLRRLIPTATMYTMAARFYKEEDNTPLAGATIRIVTMEESDKEFITNDQGIVEFNLPKDIAYAILGNKDGYTGMYSGLAEKGTDKSVVIHPIPAHKEKSGKLDVLGLMANSEGKPIAGAHVAIVDELGNEVPFTLQNSILFFEGDEGSSYSITVTADGYENWSQDIHLTSTGDERIRISMVSSTSNLPTPSTLSQLPPNSTLILVNNNTEASRIYVHDDNTGSISEIIERDGMLYLQSESNSYPLGKGDLASLRKEPVSLTTLLGVTGDQIVTIQNIYFDFNKFKLNGDNENELNKVAALLKRFPTMSLTISAHSDDRGSESYNLKLSRRRAKSVESYLLHEGIASDRLKREGYGEAIPAIPCASVDCSEEEHQKNRRAEFGLILSPIDLAPPIKEEVKLVQTPVKKAESPSPTKSGKNRYQQTIDQYGEKEIDGLTFKVTVGAYRYNHTLTFAELSDLGTVEKVHVNGITYYYLGTYTTLGEMEKIRQQVIKRGVTDASFRILYHDEKIDFATFISLVE